ncbi:MAG: hypothetical protein II836_01895, partial [Clostridia bacterium]|nr:hypothetical protein [Clostridia bacterium]
ERSSPAVGPGKSREEPAGGSSLVPVRHANKFARTKELTTLYIPNPQGSAAQTKDTAARNPKKHQRAIQRSISAQSKEASARKKKKRQRARKRA